MAESKPVLRATGQGRMASGGTVSFTVLVDGVEVGVVYDERRWSGSKLHARTWGAAWREDVTGRQPARWSGDGYATRKAAVEALLTARARSADTETGTDPEHPLEGR